MEIAPFKIKRLVLDQARLRVKTQMIGRCDDDDDFPAYLVVSTAPNNIDESMDSPTPNALAEAKQGLKAIAQDLHRIQSDPTITEAPELVIAVHGYNTEEKGIKAWYSDIYRHIAKDDRAIRDRRNLVFIGYRWSSERVSVKPGQLWRNVRALPDVPQALLAIGLLFMLSYWGWALLWEPLWQNDWLDLFGSAVLSTAVGVTVMISTLLLLRTTVYFRDVYRAINFGVPDLTELVRQIDQTIVDLRAADLHASYPDYGEAIRQAKRIAGGEKVAGIDTHEKIKLNFLGHSMGGLVITNVVRILSDVFDRRSIAQTPIPDIGNTLSLGRLILASPDVPVLSIISSRANGLASSLRRFSEAYLFCNEGDLALRLASTAANYISFPSARQNHGHRLGSIALTKTKKQGIINLDALQNKYPIDKPLGKALLEDDYDILNCLYITHSSGKGDGYLSLGELFSLEQTRLQRASLADFFTFFDCTDYKDYKLFVHENGLRDRSKKESGLLTRAKQKRHLNLWDYFELGFDALRGARDVHGGYFQGEYSRRLMYRLAFLGFEGLLEAIAEEHDLSQYRFEPALSKLDESCANKGIQVYLSPLRYRVDVQHADLYEAKEEMMRTVQPQSLSAVPMSEEGDAIATELTNPSSTTASTAPGKSPTEQSAPLTN